MELKSLILGLCCTFGMFAVKNGIGMYYALARQRRQSTRWLLLTTHCSGYFLLFMMAAYLLRRVDLPAYIETVQQVLRSGMLLHVLMAGMLLFWGWYLLTHHTDRHNQTTYGWMPLAFPCPVCLIVIGWSVAFLVKYVHKGAYLAVTGVFAGFMLLSFLALILTHFWRRQSGQSPHQILGTAMMAIAAYFLLSAVILPQFAELETVYQLTLAQPAVQTVPGKQMLAASLTMLLLTGVGFYWKYRRIRSVPE